jgi:multiple sugar transport system substrate-binding protein
MKKNFLISTLIMVFLLQVLLLPSLAADKKFDGTKINVVAQQHYSTDSLKKLLPEFEEETGIDVNLDILPQTEMFKKVDACFISKASTYDVIFMMIVNVARYARAGWLEPLDQYIENSPDMNLEDFMSGFLGAQNYKGKYYALPFYGESSCLMYRKDLFEKEGLKVPETMDELMETAKLLTKDGSYGIVMRGTRDQAAIGYIWPTFLRAFGGKFFDEDLKPVFNNEKGIEATEFFVELMQKYAPPGVANMHWNEVQISLQQGQSAMCIDATNFACTLEENDMSKVAGKIGYAPVPEGPAGRVTLIATSSMGVNSYSKNKEAAFEFMKWATSNETQIKSAELGLRPDVTRNSVFLDPNYAKMYNYDNGNWFKVTQEAMQLCKADYRPVYIPEWVQIGNTISIQIQSALTGEKDVKTALDIAAKDVENIMKNAGYYD